MRGSYALQINMQEKPDGVHPKMEKYLLRKAFDRPESPYLPESVLWRQKEQFSDGVGYDWVDRLREYSHEVSLKPCCIQPCIRRAYVMMERLCKLSQRSS